MAIAVWIRDVPPPVLADLCLQADAGPAAVEGDDLAGGHRCRCISRHGGQLIRRGWCGPTGWQDGPGHPGQ